VKPPTSGCNRLPGKILAGTTELKAPYEFEILPLTANCGDFTADYRCASTRIERVLIPII
jgi:hypothetical protein